MLGHLLSRSVTYAWLTSEGAHVVVPFLWMSGEGETRTRRDLSAPTRFPSVLLIQPDPLHVRENESMIIVRINITYES